MTATVFDNSAFAGVMRLYTPDLEMHNRFLRNYPDHRVVDQRSLADFLTAICIYDVVFLDSRSAWNEKEARIEGYTKASSDGSSASWAEQLIRLLPKEVGSIINAQWLGGSMALDEDEACAKAFDILRSSLSEKIALGADEKIPNVYFAPDYLYRPIFDKLNASSGFPLSSDLLAQAMFLHRGLFLQSRAHQANCVYMPYYYRGKMLSQLPPMVWAKAPDDGLRSAQLPLAGALRPSESDYLKSLNDYYYSLLQATTWTTYERDIPFIGSAILARARGNPSVALEIAMECREQGKLRKMFEQLDTAIRAQDRPEFESLLTRYRSELDAAARHFGVLLENRQAKTFYKLATCWAPKPVEALIDGAVSLLPENLRQWAYKASSTLISSTPVQMLFVDHVSAIRGAS